ncbi:MAG TPA: TIGR02678 family protein [Pseudonocardiaceae bacterium]
MTTPETDKEGLQRAVRILLAKPLLTTSGGDGAAISLIQANRDAVCRWFDRNLNWQLVVDREVVRLFKIGERWPSFAREAPSQRRAVLYCLVLAALEDCGEQTVISELAEKVSVLTATHDDLVNYDPDEYRERQDFVAVLRLLVAHGVLTPTREMATTKDDETGYVRADGNALYDVNHRAAGLILSSPVAPSRAGHPDQLTKEAFPDTPEAQIRRRRIELTRRLVDTPVLYFDEVPEDQVSYFHSQRYLICREIDTGLGSQIEVRAEGAALIDDELTDIPFPKEQIVQFAALAYAEALAKEVDASTGRVVPEARLADITNQVTTRVERLAKTIASEPVTESSVRSNALEMLAMLRLVERANDGLRVLPALGRYRNPTLLETEKTGKSSHSDVTEDDLWGDS